MNEVLKRALTEAGITEQDVAARLGVDSKTVRGWLEGGRPQARQRSELAEFLGVDPASIWPLVQVEGSYAHRWSVPREVWRWLFEQAEKGIDILASSGLFLAEDDDIRRVLAEKARGGVSVRILLGGPDESKVAKMRNAVALFQEVRAEIRLHETTLFASLYRGDADLLVNLHAYGIPASRTPVLHMRHDEEGDVAGTYLESFERIWSDSLLSRPVR